MSKVTVNSNRTSGANIRRDSRGRFVSNSNVRVSPKRDASGRFVSSAKVVSTKPVAKVMPKRDSRGRFMSNSAPTVVRNSKNASSFIESMIVDGDRVNVVMSKYPKTVYTYKPTASGLKAVKQVIASKGSLGEAYNKYVKGREISRTIYR